MAHISLPGLIPTMATLLILDLGRLLNVGYEKVMLLYSTSTYETADIISTYVYRSGLISQQYSFAAAVGLFNSAVGLILVISSNYASRRVVSHSLW
jgi:putative aldouronate transport system permease protein